MSVDDSQTDTSSILTTETTATDTEDFVPAGTETVREVYLISDEDAREHEDAVELVNWATFDEWRKPWHVVPLWEGSVYDEMTLWGSIPLQNDKLRKVRRAKQELMLGCFRAYLQVPGSLQTISLPRYRCRASQGCV